MVGVRGPGFKNSARLKSILAIHAAEIQTWKSWDIYVRITLLTHETPENTYLKSVENRGL